MKIVMLSLALLLASTVSLAQGDVWQTLFKEKLKEARQGDSHAQFDVASMYQNGRGVTPDRSKAINWYSKAAAQKNAKAVSRLNLLQANEERFSKVSVNAANGNKESQYKLGNMYTEGVGTDIDLARAVDTYEQAAAQRYVKAEYKLGLIYFKGTGVRSSNKTALKWFKLAADKDNAAAQFYLGKMYADGMGVKRDFETSLMWYLKSVDGGFTQARSELISVNERMKAPVLAAKPATVKVAFSKPSPAKKTARKKIVKKKSATKATAKTKQSFGIEDLMVAAWSRNDKPVAYLPSAINNCRTEKGKIACYSDDQIRKAAGGKVKYKTKSIMRKFSNDGTFQVTYRHLVINTDSKNARSGHDDSEEIGSEDASADTYAVQTGWGIEHILECQMLKISQVSCVKNKTHTFLLESPQTVVSGT